MDGQQALQEIRRIEERHGIRGLDMVKVIMVTAVDDSSNIMKAFRQGQCEAYLTKLESGKVDNQTHIRDSSDRAGCDQDMITSITELRYDILRYDRDGYSEYTHVMVTGFG